MYDKIIILNISADLVSMNGGSNFRWAIEAEERNHLWKARHEILYACMALKPGSKVNWAHSFILSASYSIWCFKYTQSLQVLDYNVFIEDVENNQFQFGSLVVWYNLRLK